MGELPGEKLSISRMMGMLEIERVMYFKNLPELRTGVRVNDKASDRLIYEIAMDDSEYFSTEFGMDVKRIAEFREPLLKWQEAFEAFRSDSSRLQFHVYGGPRLGGSTVRFSPTGEYNLDLTKEKIELLGQRVLDYEHNVGLVTPSLMRANDVDLSNLYREGDLLRLCEDNKYKFTFY